jgi:peptidyl-prolyl cis-trans isomerase C
MFKDKAFNRDSGNAAIFALAAVVIIAIGGLGYYLTTKDKGAAPVDTAVAGLESSSGETAEAPAEKPEADAASEAPITPNNPVVAKVDNTEITRMDVLSYIQTLPDNVRQAPIQQLFPMAMEQVVNAAIINEKTKGVQLDDNPEVQKQVEIARKNIVRGVYLQQLVDKKVTDSRLKKAYDEYKKAFPSVEEVNVRHILVADEAKAKDLVKQLDGGADFATLAKENSTDGTAKNGGDVGWFAKSEVVPAFADASFATKVGTYTKEPVKSEFGWHVIRVEDKRMRPVPEFEQAKPYLEVQVRREALDEIMEEWRDKADIERFDINGKPIEPAAGE